MAPQLGHAERPGTFRGLARAAMASLHSESRSPPACKGAAAGRITEGRFAPGATTLDLDGRTGAVALLYFPAVLQLGRLPG